MKFNFLVLNNWHYNFDNNALNSASYSSLKIKSVKNIILLYMSEIKDYFICGIVYIFHCLDLICGLLFDGPLSFIYGVKVGVGKGGKEAEGGRRQREEEEEGDW